MDIFHVFNLLLTYSFLLLLQKSIANRHAAWYNRLKEVRGGDFVVNMKTIGSAVVIILAAIVGLFLGAAMRVKRLHTARGHRRVRLCDLYD